MATLWPPLGSSTRTMAEMLYDAAAGLGTLTGNKLDFYVDVVGMAPAGTPVTKLRYNCYIRVIKIAHKHLFFQVTTPSAASFPADLGTPEGDSYTGIADEKQLVETIAKVMQRDRTREILEFLSKLGS